MLIYIVYVIFVGLVVLFATQNLHVVPFYFLMTFQAPLVLIVGIAFFVGFAAAIFGVLLQAVRQRKKKTSTAMAVRPRRM